MTGVDVVGRIRDWETVLPRTVTFEGKEFKRTSVEMRANSRNLYCDYFCPSFFSDERKHMSGLYCQVSIAPDEPITTEVIVAKLENLSMALTEHARRERERTEMLELDILTNGDDGVYS